METEEQNPEKNVTMNADGNVDETPNSNEPENNVSELEEELADWKEKYLRAAAEMENMRKRSIKETQDAHKYALESFMTALLPVLDSFDSADVSEEDESGMGLVRKQFYDTLVKQGLTELNPVGEAFDPNLHQAIQRVESDECEEDHIVQVFQKGYCLNDRLIRPAMVSVATK